jgi:CspA family cold shock protein
MTTGTIKFFNASKGFGFVTPDGGGADIFLPAAAVTASGIAIVSPGQRVTFEQAADKKGPKVVALQLLGETVVKALAPAPERVKVYCDPSSDVVADVLSVIRAAGYQLQLLDYITTPLGQDQLRTLSHLLSGSGKSLVRRHDPLFSALQLDDRFIGDQDFWTTIAEHPALINGPVLVLSGKARICRSPEEAQLFLGKGGEAAMPKPKTLSPRIVALIRGESLSALPKVDAIAPELPPQPLKASSTVHPVTEVTEVTVKPKRKVAAKPHAAKAEKKKTATKSVRKPVKKPKK